MIIERGRVIDEDGAVMAQEAMRELRKYVMRHQGEIAQGVGDFGLLRRTFICVTMREPRV